MDIFINTSDCLADNGIGCFMFSTKDDAVKNVTEILKQQGLHIIFLKDTSNIKKTS